MDQSQSSDSALAVISYSRHRGSERGRSFHIHLVNAPNQRTYLANQPSLKYLIFRPSLSPKNIFSLIQSSTPHLLLSTSPPLHLSTSPPLLLSLSSPSGISFQKQFIHLFSRKPTLTLESSSLENETSLVLSSQSIPASANIISTMFQHSLIQSAHCTGLQTVKQIKSLLAGAAIVSTTFCLLPSQCSERSRTFIPISNSTDATVELTGGGLKRSLTNNGSATSIPFGIESEVCFDFSLAPSSTYLFIPDFPEGTIVCSLFSYLLLASTQLAAFRSISGKQSVICIHRLLPRRMWLL
jgi:hypothetical protein